MTVQNLSLLYSFFLQMRRIMKKIPFLVIFMVAALSANVLIEDFEDNDRSSLLDPKDSWFVFSDSSDAGCQEQFEGYPCSVFNTFYMDFQFDDWSYEPRKFTYEAEVPETTYVAILDTTVSDTSCVDTLDSACVTVIDTVGIDTVIKKVVADRDTLMYFPLRSESPFNTADRKAAGPKVVLLMLMIPM